MLVALVEAYRWTGDDAYRAALLKTFGWVWTHQIDHERGDWFEKVAWDGRPLALNKGHGWKHATSR